MPFRSGPFTLWQQLQFLTDALVNACMHSYSITHFLFSTYTVQVYVYTLVQGEWSWLHSASGVRARQIDDLIDRVSQFDEQYSTLRGFVEGGTQLLDTQKPVGDTSVRIDEQMETCQVSYMYIRKYSMCFCVTYFFLLIEHVNFPSLYNSYNIINFNCCRSFGLR